VRAHDLHTPLCKQLILSVNPTDPSSAQRIIGAISYSFVGSSCRSIEPIDYWSDWQFYRHANTTTSAPLRRGTRRLESEVAWESCQCTRSAHEIRRSLSAHDCVGKIVNDRSRPILLKNSKMHSSQFLAKLNRSCELLPRTAASSVRTILVARNTKSRLPPRPKLNEGPEGLQSFERLRKRSFSTE
jgi:hypothetical protein